MSFWLNSTCLLERQGDGKCGPMWFSRIFLYGFECYTLQWTADSTSSVFSIHVPLKGWCAVKKKAKITPSVGIEPTTTWLKATRSTTELGRLAHSISERNIFVTPVLHTYVPLRKIYKLETRRAFPHLTPNSNENWEWSLSTHGSVFFSTSGEVRTSDSWLCAQSLAVSLYPRAKKYCSLFLFWNPETSPRT